MEAPLPAIERLRPAAVAETHSAVVIFVGDRAFKMKKPVDLAFLDHDKDAYLPDLEAILARGWLHPGSVVVADNIKMPGAPDYLAYMREHEGREWHTVEHHAHVEYQPLLKDMVLESEYVRRAPFDPGRGPDTVPADNQSFERRTDTDGTT